MALGNDETGVGRKILTMKSLNEAPIGSMAFETIEKFEATIVAAQIHISGCNRFVLQESRLKDGKPVARTSSDVQTVEVKKKKKDGFVVEPGAASDVMGLRARSLPTGIEGTITSVEFGGHGQRDFWIQPSKREKNGDRQEGIWASEEFVELLEKRRVIEAKATGTGFVNCAINQR